MQRYRPPTFRINRRAPLANGFVFAGLGGGASTLKYVDASGYSNHGTLTNMDPATDWVWDSTLGRWCLDFDGSSHYVLLPDMSLGSGDFSLSAWIKPNVVDVYNIIFGKDGPDNREYTFGFGYTPRKLVFYVAIGSVVIEGSKSLVAGDWLHIAVVRKSGVITLYQDGVADSAGRANTTNIVASTATNLGRRERSGGQQYYKGKLADPLQLSRALSTYEIQQLADPSNVMLSGLILPPARRLWPVAVSGESNLIIPHHGMMAM